eukprot:TRINITY_DN19853_c0_g1_i1.p1 TRINITY_DN19853_c0_g1~~TRINITY_DN19853_c0_g1_i1.p1  ORF type:complete len:307 (+),score=62.15 TRINITY_DN19853_c0_g1_i1:28-948(+)
MLRMATATNCQELGTAIRHYRLRKAATAGIAAAMTAASGVADGMNMASPASPPRKDTAEVAKAKAKGGGKSKKTQESRHVMISKALTQVLRHRASSLSLDVRPDGYIELDSVLKCSLLDKYQPTLQEVEKIVKDSDKQRFTLQKIDGALRIRANQGHSMKEVQDDLLLEQLQLEAPDRLPAEVVHGTYFRYWQSILKSGLLAGGVNGAKFRNHVHFAIGLPREAGVISGMRDGCQLAIYLDLEKALQAGLPVYRSANDVVLSPGFDGGVIPTSYFSRAVRLKDGKQIWPRNETADSQFDEVPENKA